MKILWHTASYSVKDPSNMNNLVANVERIMNDITTPSSAKVTWFHNSYPTNEGIQFVVTAIVETG